MSNIKYDDTDYLINREESIEYIVQLTDEQYRNLVDVIRKEVKKNLNKK